MEKPHSTIIFIPHDRARFRKLKISHRLLFSVISVVASSLCPSVFFTVQYYSSLQQTEFYHSATASSRQLEVELRTANTQLIQSMRKLEAATAQLIQDRRENEKQLARVREQYEHLKVLSAGQEQIAEAHRAILERRPFRERVLEQTTAFLVGVLSSLVATWVLYLKKAEPISEEERRRAGLD